MSETVTDQIEAAEEAIEEVVDQLDDSGETQTEEASQDETQQQEEEKVPLSALKKVRKESQEAKLENQILKQQMSNMQQPAQQPQVDNSNDLLTVGQNNRNLEEWKRSILEEAYMEQNPNVVDRIKTELPEILSNPKNHWLADSLKQAPNRLLRGQQILEMFKPAKRQALPGVNRENTPKSPQSVAKTNKLSTADRIMEMSDQELEEWRVSQKRKIR